MKIANRHEEIARVHEALRSFAERHGVDAAMRRTLGVVFDELLTNTIAYGYDGEKDGEIRLTLTLRDGSMHATIRDDARPFNPLERAAPDTRATVERRSIGGLGIHLVREMAERVSYERDGNANVVSLKIGARAAGE